MKRITLVAGLMLTTLIATPSAALGLNSIEGRSAPQRIENPKPNKTKAHIKREKQKQKQKQKKKQKAVKQRKFVQHRRGHKLRHNTISLGHLITFGNARFRFSDGRYYKKMAHGYTPTHPPLGLKIRHLPRNAKRIFHRNTAYYLAYGIYYVAVGNGYKVVNSPSFSSNTQAVYQLGEYYDALPADVEAVVINSQQYFKYHSIYFLPQVKDEQIHYLALKLD